MTNEAEEPEANGSTGLSSAIDFVWWNTSLSPPGAKSRATDDQLDFVVTQLMTIRLIYGWDVLGLGEVNATDVAAIVDGLGEPTISSVDMANPSGNAVNDTAIVFDRKKLTLVDDKSLFDKHGGRTLKAGHMATFICNTTNEVLNVVVAHWPGRLYQGAAEPARAQLGMSLHQSIMDIRRSSPNIVVMGDFNDDPASPSLAQHLFATRDRSLAVNRDYLLYNPFWRLMGESEPFGGASQGICGSHYYKGTSDSHWFTFDQILFSPAFLGEGLFMLDEAATRIVELPGLTDRILSGTSIYDHYPVSSTIKQKV